MKPSEDYIRLLREQYARKRQQALAECQDEELVVEELDPAEGRILCLQEELRKSERRIDELKAERNDLEVESDQFSDRCARLEEEVNTLKNASLVRL